MSQTSISASQKISHAIVIGGSIARLITSRILAESFERVTVLERDYSAEIAEPRAELPQSNQGHFLLTRGKQILEQLFPGFVEVISAQGAIEKSKKYLLK